MRLDLFKFAMSNVLGTLFLWKLILVGNFFVVDNLSHIFFFSEIPIH